VCSTLKPAADKSLAMSATGRSGEVVTTHARCLAPFVVFADFFAMRCPYLCAPVRNITRRSWRLHESPADLRGRQAERSGRRDQLVPKVHAPQAGTRFGPERRAAG